MAYEKILILEANWAKDDNHYIRDSRSTSEIYTSFESILSMRETPVFAITRPLLAFRFKDDLTQFANLPSNQRGPNVVILSAHGDNDIRFDDDFEVFDTRVLSGIDDEIDINTVVSELASEDDPPLKRTIFILDSCSIGESIESFLSASKALGVVGFSESADWIDSSVFILALLLKFQAEGVFQMRRISPIKPNGILSAMESGPYRSLMRRLGVEYKFRPLADRRRRRRRRSRSGRKSS